MEPEIKNKFSNIYAKIQAIEERETKLIDMVKKLTNITESFENRIYAFEEKELHANNK